MNFILSLLPILLIIYLMIWRRWGSVRAGAAGYLSALVIAFGFFGANPVLLAYAQAKALILGLDVLMIIIPAFLFYRVCDEAGAIHAIGLTLPSLTVDRAMQALLIGWVFASFLQGVGGFGVPVAVTAPILVSLGINPLTAVVIPSIGHGWAVTFGSLGSSFQALIVATGMPAQTLAPAAAIFLGIACLVSGPMVAHIVGGWGAVLRLFIPTLLIGAVMAGVQYLVAVYGPWHIAGFSAASAGLVIGVPLAYVFGKRTKRGPSLDWRAILIALIGYAIMVVVVLSAQFFSPLQQALNQLSLQVSFPQITTNLGFVNPATASRRISIFDHTGMLLIYTSLLTYLVYWLTGRYQAGAAGRILNGTLRRVMPSCVSILSMVSMAVIMEYSGMTDTIARGLAGFLGSLFPMLSPWIGALGAFMTGSNTNSNVVFGALQKQTAELLGISVAVILAAQTAGGSIGSAAAPTKVVIGTSTADMNGREGEVLRQMFGYTMFLIALLSLLTVIGILLTQ